MEGHEEERNAAEFSAAIAASIQIQRKKLGMTQKNLADKFNQITNKSITKSGINHLFIRIKKLAESLKSGEKNDK